MDAEVLLSATDGTDTETDEEYRARALAVIQNRGSRYGKRGDYGAWAKEADAEIAYAWEVPNFEETASLGVVVSSAGLAALSSGAIANAKTLIEANALGGVSVTVVNANIKTVNFSLAILSDTEDMRAAVEAALGAYIKEREAPKAISISKLQEHLEAKVSGLTSVAIYSPVNDIVTGAREVAKLGAVTWN